MTTQTPTPDQITDRLIFRDSPDGNTDYLCGWAGEWPPPDRMGLAYGLESGMTMAFEVDNPFITQVQEHPTIAVTFYRLASASAASEAAPADAHWFRGALYLPE